MDLKFKKISKIEIAKISDNYNLSKKQKIEIFNNEIVKQNKTAQISEQIKRNCILKIKLLKKEIEKYSVEGWAKYQM